MHPAADLAARMTSRHVSRYGPRSSGVTRSQPATIIISRANASRPNRQFDISVAACVTGTRLLPQAPPSTRNILLTADAVPNEMKTTVNATPIGKRRRYPLAFGSPSALALKKLTKQTTDMNGKSRYTKSLM